MKTLQGDSGYLFSAVPESVFVVVHDHQLVYSTGRNNYSTTIKGADSMDMDGKIGQSSLI